MRRTKDCKLYQDIASATPNAPNLGKEVPPLSKNSQSSSITNDYLGDLERAFELSLRLRSKFVFYYKLRWRIRKYLYFPI